MRPFVLIAVILLKTITQGKKLYLCFVNIPQSIMSLSSVRHPLYVNERMSSFVGISLHVIIFLVSNIYSMGKSIWGMTWFQIIEERAAPKALLRIYIPIEAHREHIIRITRYCSMLSNSNIRWGQFNPCFTESHQHFTHQSWHFETSWRK